MRAARLDIDLAALRHNLQIARRHAPHSRVAAVVKANAYGHGLLPAAHCLAEAGADALVVSLPGEARALREAGLTLPILVLQGTHAAADLAWAASAAVQLVIHCPQQLELLESTPLPEPVSVWLKLNTGMHRLGFAPDQARALIERLEHLPQVRRPIHLMSHLACADDLSSEATAQQMAWFDQATHDLPNPHSLANSAGILGWPASRRDWVRPGIMLYGASPFAEGAPVQQWDLQGVMHLQAPIIAIQHCPAGGRIGYGATWTCPEAMPIAVISAGYADGYPRHADNGTPVLINGQRLPLVGRVSMDMLTVDLREAKHIDVGTQATLWGPQLPVEEVARAAGTISYELLCNAGAHVPVRWLNA